MSWIFFALGSAVFAALVAIFGKIGISQVDSTLATAVRAVIMAVFLVGLTLALDKAKFLSSITVRPFIFIVLSGIAGALSWLCYFYALKVGPVDGVVAIDRTSVIFAAVLAAIFLAEGLSWKAGLGAMFVAFGAILMSLPK